MEAPERGALMLVRFIAATLIGWTAVELALYVAVCRNHNPRLPVEISPCVVRSVPLLAGAAMFIKARSIAHWLSDKLDL